MLINRLTMGINSLVHHPGFKKYFANTSWLFFEQCIRVVTGLLIGIWVARYLGPKQYGLLSYVMAFVAIFGPVARFGFERILVRDLVKDAYAQHYRLGTAFWLRLVGAVVSLVLVLLSSFFTNHVSTTQTYILIIAFALFFQSFEVVEAFFQAKVQSKSIALSRLVQLFFSAVLKIYFIWIEAPLFWFVIIILFEQIVLAFALLFIYQRQSNPRFIGVFDQALAKQYLKQCLPVILSGVVLMIQMRVDQLMLKAMIGDEAVGIYTSANRLIEALLFVPGLLISALFPAIINAREVSILQYRKRLFHLYRLMMVLFIIVAIPVYLFSESIIIFLYGNAYASAAALLMVMSLRILLINYDAVRNAFLMAENQVKYLLFSTTIGALLNIILNYYWIPEFQAMGAVYATLISFFFTTFILDVCNANARQDLKLRYKSLLLVNF